MKKNKQLATFKSADDRIATYNRKFYGLVGVGSVVSLGALAYWSQAFTSVSAANTIGDVIALGSLATSTGWWIFAGGVIAAILAVALARNNKATAGILGAGLLLASIVGAVVTGMPLSVSQEDQTAMVYQTLDLENPVWEDTPKSDYKNIYKPRTSDTFTSEEWYALSTDEQDALRINDSGKITPGKNIVHRGQEKKLNDGSYLQQVGAKKVCLFEDAETLKSGEFKNCVDMTAPIDNYKTAKQVTLTGMPLVPPLIPAVATFVPIALIGGLWQNKSKRQTEIMATGTSENLLEERWVTAKANLDSINLAWGDLCADPLSALDHSALLDVSQKRTKDFMDSLSASTDFMSIASRHKRTDRIVGQLESHVRETKINWDEAQRYSSQVGTDWMTPEEQKIAKTARGLLELAMDPGATMAERANAAGQAQKMLNKLVSIAVPPPSMLMLERLTALQLDAPVN